MPGDELYQQCAQTIARFYHYLDRSDYDGLQRLLDADTIWLRKGETLQGPQAILRALRERDPARRTSHQVSNLYVARGADENTATAHYYVTVYDNLAPDGAFQLKTIMLSEDSFQLRQGRWILTAKRAGKYT